MRLQSAILAAKMHANYAAVKIEKREGKQPHSVNVTHILRPYYVECGLRSLKIYFIYRSNFLRELFV